MTTRSHGSRRGKTSAGRAFSLVELLVTMVIITILASLSLSGLAVARTRSKVARSQTTIRKLHDLVVPRYFEYLERRLDDSVWDNYKTQAEDAAGPDDIALAAWMRLAQIRGLLVHELPDQWVDVRDVIYPTASPPLPSTPPLLSRYLSFRGAQRAPAALGLTNGSAETLHMLVALGSSDADALEAFREDEIGDTDGDGAREFLDGFGRPIHFLRWAPGFFRERGLTTAPDPFDPYRLNVSNGGDSFLLTPLIVSAGPDERFSLLRDATHSIEDEGDGRTSVRAGGSGFLPLPYDPFAPRECGQSDPSAAALARDNITNLGLR